MANSFRAGVATTLLSQDIPLTAVRDLLGHKTLAMSGRYVERDTEPLRAAADSVAGKIADALEGKEAEVVELSKAKR